MVTDPREYHRFNGERLGEAIASYLDSRHPEMAIQLYRVFCTTPIDLDLVEPGRYLLSEPLIAVEVDRGPPTGGPTWYEGEHDDCPIAVRHTHADVCAICGQPIEPEAHHWTKEGFPQHFLCEEPPLCGACGRFHAEGECDLEPVVFYEPPVDVYGTVFDPTDQIFGPIMAALQNGDFEQAAELVGFLAVGGDDGR